MKMSQKEIFEKLIEYKELNKDALRLMKVKKYTLTLEEVIDEIQEFYKAMLGNIALDSYNIGRYRRGWLMRAEMEKKYK